MSVVIRKLEELYYEKTNIYGNKANTLSRMISLGVPILPGFCITFDCEQDFTSQIKDSVEHIEELFSSLINSSKSHSVIVRSSADLEDLDTSLFPGVFSSVPSVIDLPGLFAAIHTCFCSLKSAKVEQYIKDKQIKFAIKHFTIIVQQELFPEYSGVASTQFPLDGYLSRGLMLIELTSGTNHQLIKGLTCANTYTLLNDNDAFSFRKIVERVKIPVSIETHLLRQLYQLLIKLKKHFQKPIEIEWGYADGIMYLFQARPFPTIVSSYRKNHKISIFEEDENEGLKYQAMHFFAKNGLFPREAIFFPSKTPKDAIAKSLQIYANNTPLTIRYSREQEIGLPRYFASNVEDATRYIIHTKDTDWSVIVYESISVFDSYELYLDPHKIVLEHVPGIWESDSFLHADTISLENEALKIWLVDKPRTAKIETACGTTTTSSPPMMLNDVLIWLYKHLPTLEKLRKYFSNDLPINLHFVSDGKQNFFLNSRITNSIDCVNQDESKLYTIREVSDISGWDGTSSILFCPKLCRGEEFFLAEFIPFLKAASVPVFVEFGILSHPAIMLREFGIPVVPKFMCHHFFEISYSSFLEGVYKK